MMSMLFFSERRWSCASASTSSPSSRLPLTPLSHSNTSTLVFNHALGSDRDNATHTMTYTAAAILSMCQLTRGGLIFVALLSGGDYHAGVPNAGVEVGAALARCGFGDSLLTATQDYFDGKKTEAQFDAWLKDWRAEVKEELRTNARKYMKTKKPTLAKNFPTNFPDWDVLEMYIRPVTSEFKPVATSSQPPASSQPSSSQPTSQTTIDYISTAFSISKFPSTAAAKAYYSTKLTFTSEPSIPALAHVCERFFEWGYRAMIVKRFATIVWPCIVCRLMRRATIRGITAVSGKLASEYFAGEKTAVRAGEEDNEKIFTKITLQRRHHSTDNALEYRVSLTPRVFVKLAHKGITDMRGPPEQDLSDWEEDELDDHDSDGDGKKKKGKAGTTNFDPEAPLRIWVPAVVLKVVEPGLVEEWEDKEAKKAEKKAKRAGTSSSSKKYLGKKGNRPVQVSDEDEEECYSNLLAEAKSKKKSGKAVVPAVFPMSSPPPIPVPIFADREEDTSNTETEVVLPQGIRVSGTTASSALASFPLSSSPPITLSSPSTDMLNVTNIGIPKGKDKGKVDGAFKARKNARSEVHAKPSGSMLGRSGDVSNGSIKHQDASEKSNNAPSSRTPTKAKAKAKKVVLERRSKVADVAALFDGANVFKDLTSRPSSPTKLPAQKTEWDMQRTASTESRVSNISALFSEPQPSQASSRATSVPGSPRKQPMPFPMDVNELENVDWAMAFKAVGADTTPKGKGKATEKLHRPRAMRKLQKSSRQSKDHGKTLSHEFWESSDRENDGRASQSPIRPMKGVEKVHATRVAMTEKRRVDRKGVECIVISSDEEDSRRKTVPSTHAKSRPRAGIVTVEGRDRKRAPDPREVIEISD